MQRMIIWLGRGNENVVSVLVSHYWLIDDS